MRLKPNITGALIRRGNPTHRDTPEMGAHRGKATRGPREKVDINKERAEASGETTSADHLILHCLPPEPQENKFLLFKTIQPEVFCYCNWS